MLRSHLFKVLSISAVIVVCTAAIAGGYNYDSQGFMLEPQFKVNQETDADYGHAKGDTYIYAGYEYTYRFLADHNQNVTDGSGNLLSYKVNGNTPKDFNSIEVGLGTALTKYLDLQLAYVQQFTEKLNGTTTNGSSMQNTISMQGLDANLLVIFNPDDQIQVGGKIGVRVADFHEKVIVSNTSYYPVDDTTEINPRFGLDVIFQLDHAFAIRTGVAYTLSAYRTIYNGSIDGFAGLSYTF